jgi:hypothetical protein
MKINKYLALAMLGIVCASIQYATQDVWKIPNKNLRYDQVTFLTAHNAFANYQEGWQYAMQELSIKNQLEYGVRGLMLDVYPSRKGDEIVLCHGGCGFWHHIFNQHMISFDPTHKTLRSTLTEINDWLDQNPSEIITIFLESYVDPALLDTYIKSHEIFKKTLTPQLKHNLCIRKLTQSSSSKKSSFSKYDPCEIWPKIQKFIDLNLRVVFFIEPHQRGYIYEDFFGFIPVWKYVYETQYGEHDIQKACVERDESKRYKGSNRDLYLLNYFPSLRGKLAYLKLFDTSFVQLSEEKANSYEQVINLIKTCHKTGVMKNKTPNFIALDFVDKGNPLKVVNELNATHATLLTGTENEISNAGKISKDAVEV